MSNHIQTVCTITFGECMKAQDLPSLTFTLVTSKASNFYFTGISYITVYRKEIIFKSRKFYTDRFSNNFNLINYFIINIF